jgi:hypothetical protein
VSRYKMSQSQKIVKVQDLYWVQMSALPNVAERSWVSGCKNHYKFVLSVGAKAKSMTNNLPILSVLGVRATYFYSGYNVLSHPEILILELRMSRHGQLELSC